MATGTELASAWITLYPKFSKDFNSSVSSAVGNIGSGVGTKIGAALSVSLGNTIARALEQAIGAIKRHAGDSIERADILNNYPIQMKNFGYAAEDAEASINKLHDAVIGLPTALDAIANTTARLAPMRSSLGDATDLAIALNNAIVAGGQSTVLQKNALEQFSQMLAVNKVDTMAWRSVINAMPAQMQQLTDSIMGTGHSVWDLYEAMKSEDGKSAAVSFEDFIEHLMKLNEEGINGLPSFAEQAKNATFGIGTALQNVQNRLADAGARIIDGIGRDRIATAINDVSKQFGGWADKTVGFIQAVEAPTLGLAGSMLTLGSTVKNVIVQSGIINTQTIIDALYTMSDILDNHISPFISGFGGRLTSAVATLKDVLSEATRGLLDWYNTAKNAFNTSRGDLSAFGHGALELARQMGRDMLPVLKTMTATYIPLVSRGLAAAAGAAQSTYNRILPSLSRIANVIVPLVADGIQLITERFDAASDVFETVADLAATATEDFLPRLGALARDLLPHVDEALKAVASRARNVYDAIAPTFTSMADSIIPALGQAIDRVIKLINSPAIERVAVAVSEGIAGVLGTVIGQLDAVFDILEDVEGIAGDAIGEIVPRLSQLAQTVLPRIVKIISVIVKTARDVYDKVAPPLGRLADAIIPAVGDALDSIVSIIEGPVATAFGRIASVAGGAVDKIAEIFPDLFANIMGTVNGPLAESFGRVADAAARGVETIGARFPAVLNAVVGIIEGPVTSAFITVADFVADVIVGIADRLPAMLDILSRVWAVIESIATALLPVFKSVLTSTFGDIFGEAVDPLTFILDSIVTIADYLAGKLEVHKDSIVSFVTDVANGVGGLIVKVAHLATTLLPQAKKNVESIWDTLNKKTEMPTVAGAFDTLGNILDFVANTASEFFTAITKGLEKTPKETFDLIGDALKRIGDVMSTFWAENKDQLFKLVTDLVPALVLLLGQVLQGVADIAEAFAPNMNAIVQQTLPDLIKKLSDFAQNTLPKITDKIAEIAGNLTPEKIGKILKLLAAIGAVKTGLNLFGDAGYELYKFERSVHDFKEFGNLFDRVAGKFIDVLPRTQTMNDAEMRYNNARKAEAKKLQIPESRVKPVSGTERLQVWIEAYKQQITEAVQDKFTDITSTMDAGALTRRLEREAAKEKENLSRLGEQVGDTVVGTASSINQSIEKRVTENLSGIDVEGPVNGVASSVAGAVENEVSEHLDGLDNAIADAVKGQVSNGLADGVTVPDLSAFVPKEDKSSAVDGAVKALKDHKAYTADDAMRDFAHVIPEDTLFLDDEHVKNTYRLIAKKINTEGASASRDISSNIGNIISEAIDYREYTQDDAKKAFSYLISKYKAFDNEEELSALTEDLAKAMTDGTLKKDGEADTIFERLVNKLKKPLEEMRAKSQHKDTENLARLVGGINENQKNDNTSNTAYSRAYESFSDFSDEKAEGIIQRHLNALFEKRQQRKSLDSYVDDKFADRVLRYFDGDTDKTRDTLQKVSDAIEKGQIADPRKSSNALRLIDKRGKLFNDDNKNRLANFLNPPDVKTFKGAFDRIGNAYHSSFKKANTKTLGLFGSIKSAIGTAFQKGYGFANKNFFAPAAQALGGIGTKLSGALAGPLSTVPTAFAGILGSVKGVIAGIGQAFLTVFTGPVGIAALIVAALIGAFVAFTPEGRKIFDDFVGRIKNLWDEKIAKPFGQFIETVKQVYEEKIKPHVDNLVKALEPAATMIADTIGDAIEGIFDFVKNIFDFLNSPEGRPVLDAIAEVIGAIIDALALVVRIVMTAFSIARRFAELIITIDTNIIKAVHNFFDSIFNGGKDQWGYAEWTDPLHNLGEDLTSLWKDDKSFLAGPMNGLGEGLKSATDAIKEYSHMTAEQTAQKMAQQDTSGALKDAYATTEEIRARQEAGLNVSNVSSQSPLNKPLNLNIDGKKVAQTTLPAVTTASGTYTMNYQRGM